MNVSQMVNQGYSLDAIRSEIDKCVVRCTNCHMRVEKQRRETIYFKQVKTYTVLGNQVLFSCR